MIVWHILYFLHFHFPTGNQNVNVRETHFLVLHKYDITNYIQIPISNDYKMFTEDYLN